MHVCILHFAKYTFRSSLGLLVGKSSSGSTRRLILVCCANVVIFFCLSAAAVGRFSPHFTGTRLALAAQMRDYACTSVSVIYPNMSVRLWLCVYVNLNFQNWGAYTQIVATGKLGGLQKTYIIHMKPTFRIF